MPVVTRQDPEISETLSVIFETSSQRQLDTSESLPLRIAEFSSRFVSFS